MKYRILKEFLPRVIVGQECEVDEDGEIGILYRDRDMNGNFDNFSSRYG